MNNYKSFICYFSLIIFFYISCGQKKINENTTSYYLDLNPMTLEGLLQIPYSNNGGKPFVKIEKISENEKKISLFYKKEPLDFQYTYDGKAWVTSFISNSEGCLQYCYVFILNNKKMLFRYCGNPYSDSTFFLKSFMTISNDITIDYLFKENVINKSPYEVMNQQEVLAKASYKDMFLRKLIKGNLLEQYSYRTNILTGEKYGESKRVYDLGDLSVNWFTNCASCFLPIEQ